MTASEDARGIPYLLTGATTIIGTGEATPNPEEFATNDDVLAILRNAGVDTGDKTGASTERLVGIATRWLTRPEVSSFDLALGAAQNAIAMAQERESGFTPEAINLVHSGGSTPDQIYPAIACRLQHAVEVPVGACEARDIMLACTSGIDAMVLADARLRQLSAHSIGRGNEPKPFYALVAFGETIATLANQPTSLDFTLWGCGGGAMVLKYDPFGKPGTGILGSRCLSDGERADWTESVGVGVRPDYVGRPHHATMGTHGKDIHRYALREVAKQARSFVAQEGIDPTATGAAFLPHNSNLSMQMGIGKDLGYCPERVFTCIRERGNTSSASILITLDNYNRRGLVNPGDRLLFAAFGGGMSMAFVDYLWV